MENSFKSKLKTDTTDNIKYSILYFVELESGSGFFVFDS